jgi:ribosomal protein L12E/L44/L45/RPP1/RPP2
MLTDADVAEAWGESLANWAVYITNSPYSSSPQQAGGGGGGARLSSQQQQEEEEEEEEKEEEEEEAGADAPHAQADVTHGKHALKV